MGAQTTDMAAGGILVRQGVASGVNVAVISLLDRRLNTHGEPTTWAFQRDVEAALYGNGFACQSGAVYRLLQRSGMGPRALPLKKASIAEGLVTQPEFNWMRGHLGGGARSFTLIPLDALRASIETYGRGKRSEALVEALGMENPESWQSEEEGEEEGEERKSCCSATTC